MASHSGAIQQKAKVFQSQKKIIGTMDLKPDFLRLCFQSLEILTLTSQYIQSLMKFSSHIMKSYTLNFTVHGINTINQPQLHKPAAIPKRSILFEYKAL